MIASGRVTRPTPPTPSNVPYTIQRLMALPQGKEIVYYRGDFDADITRCNRTGHDRGAPNYAALLRSIRDAAQDLSAQGKIILPEERPGIRSGVHYDTHGGGRRAVPYTAKYTEYVAIGNV